jgi:hypothetical protein
MLASNFFFLITVVLYVNVSETALASEFSQGYSIYGVHPVRVALSSAYALLKT